MGKNVNDFQEEGISQHRTTKWKHWPVVKGMERGTGNWISHEVDRLINTGQLSPVNDVLAIIDLSLCNNIHTK